MRRANILRRGRGMLCVLTALILLLFIAGLDSPVVFANGLTVFPTPLGASSNVQCWPTSYVVVAGKEVYCRVRTYSGASLLGDNDPNTLCKIRLNACAMNVEGYAPKEYVISLNNATYYSKGVYYFLFHPTLVGLYTIRAHVQGATTNAVLTATTKLQVNAEATIDRSKATPVCTIASVGGSRTCKYENRDRFGNRVGTLTFTTPTSTFTAAEDGKAIPGTCALPDPWS